MNVSIATARKACETARARVVVVAFDEHGQFCVTSYGETKAECKAVAVLCDTIANMLQDGRLSAP